MTDKTTLVIGLDGATWRLVDKWIKEGELPTIQLIKNNTTVGTMQSCLSPVTCLD